LNVLGTSLSGEPVTFPVQGMDGGSVSMLAVQLGTGKPGHARDICLSCLA
jgi:hypothetical protein